MKFSVPTNWQDDLLPVFRAPEIYEVYGKLARDFVGGGRPAYSLFNISRRRAAGYVRKIHESQCEFNYLLNGCCLGGREFTRRGLHEIFRLLDWLNEIGVDSVTVSLPYLAEVVKKRDPSLKIKVSTMARVDSLQRAVFWESLGADSITLSHTRLNRNFALLKQIRKNIRCKLQLLANNHCLYNCPMEEYHESVVSHASQSIAFNGSCVFDYCYLKCRYQKISDPGFLISSPWIRPEDVQLYEDMGIDSIKLADRRLPSASLSRIITAYLNRRYEDNLLDLFPNLGVSSPTGLYNILLRIKHFFRPFSINIFMIPRLKKLLEKIDIFIDNKALDGFIDFFLTHDCQTISCGDCGYCREVAAKAVRLDKDYQSKVCQEYGKFLEELSYGTAFGYLQRTPKR